MSTEAEVSKVGKATVVVSRRGCQTIILAGVGKKLSSREIYTYPNHTIAEAKKIATESSQTVFLHELKHDLTKFQGNRIVKSKIYQAFSAASTLFPLRIAS